MAIDFPNSPSVNDSFTVGNRTWIWDGTTWELLTTASDPIQKTIVDAKGDLIGGTGSDTVARLAVGTNEHRLVADSGETTGLKYVADTTNYAVGAKGDLLVGTAADTVSNLAVGTNGQVLVADSGETTGLKWAVAFADVSVRAKQTGSTSLTQSAWTTIAFAGEDFDTDSMHDNATNNSRITFNTAGKYIVGGTVAAGSNITHGARIILNGSTVICGSSLANSNANPEFASASTIYDFAVTDYIQLQGWTANSGQSTSGDAQTNFWATKIEA